MSYQIERNEQYGSLEIKFAEKPESVVRDKLKALKFKWNGAKGIWYGYAEESDLMAILEGKRTLAEVKPKESKPKALSFDKKMLEAEYAKAYDSSPKWLKYFMDKTATIAELPNGDILPIDKQTIETRFCFGESGYDYEEASDMAHVARTSETYFKAENMKEFNDTIERLKEKETDYLNWRVVLYKIKGWCGRKPAEGCKLIGMKFMQLHDIIDALGGSCCLADLPGTEFTDRYGDTYRIPTKEEKECILNAYEQARAAHEKKVDAYLKRYGTSKVHSWTYWRDA